MLPAAKVPWPLGELFPPAVSGRVGELPDVMSPRYVSEPGVVVDRTVNVVEPPLVVCGFDVRSVVNVPAVRVNVTE